jgi:hypothetical protein
VKKFIIIISNPENIQAKELEGLNRKFTIICWYDRFEGIFLSHRKMVPE